jgi:dethiobiotin synthetase
VAAEQEGVKVDLQLIKKAYKKLKRRHQFMVVEGAGGLLAPIAKDTLLPELIKLLDLPLLVVARSSLGTINHILLTLSYCQQEGLEVVGTIINKSSPDTDPAEENNPQYITQFGTAPLWGSFPYLRDYTGVKGNRDFLAQLFSQHIDIKGLLKSLDLSGR